MLAKIFGVCVALLIIFVWIPSFTIGFLYGGILFTTYSLNLVEMNVAVKDGNTWQNCESYDRKRFKC